MRAPALSLFALTLAACTPAVPDSGSGVGFSEYDTYQAAPVPMPTAPASGFSPDSAAAAIDRATGGAPAPLQPAPMATVPMATTPQPIATMPTDTARPRGNAPTGIKEETGELVHINAANSTGISDEQDFAAVASRETIESDKARIERNRAQYQVDQPGALPQRPGNTGPSIVEFALSTSHPIGTQMYRRSGLRLTSAEAACAKFASPDLAQEAFLASGGPDRDRKGLDPDGDGYACAWNPAPFRAALQ